MFLLAPKVHHTKFALLTLTPGTTWPQVRPLQHSLSCIQGSARPVHWAELSLGDATAAAEMLAVQSTAERARYLMNCMV
jgi:hypothetical protein